MSLNYFQRDIYDIHFEHTGTTLDESMRDVSLTLLFSHFSTSSIRPILQNMIEIGGIHVESPKQLPQDIQEFLDSSPEGVIYFSMGSIIQAVNWPDEKREALVNAFSKIKQKVLWKYENDTLPNNPPNVKIGKWLPQSDILAHPNVKLFISHGGLLGTTEAIAAGKPILGIPIYGDQKMNLNRAVREGYGLMLNLESITEETISSSLQELLTNPKYSKNAEKISNLFLDRPQKVQETTVYWVEYFIRHHGAHHLKSISSELNLIEFYLIDVYFTIFLILFVSFKVFKAIFKCILSVFFGEGVKEKVA